MKSLREVFEGIKDGNLSAVTEFSKFNAGFFCNFSIEAEPKNRAEALTKTLEWAKFSAEQSRARAENNHRSWCYKVADLAVANAEAAGRNKDGVWLAACEQAEANAPDFSEAEAFDVLVAEIELALEAAKQEEPKILRVCRVCGDKSLISRDPADPEWATSVTCVCLDCPDDGKGWAHC